METTNYIAQCRISDCATVRVLSINPNAELICDRECSCLKESKNGSFQCSIERIKHLVDCKASALTIDYEIYLDRKADWDWDVRDSDFRIIDEEGDIYEGRFICEDFISPEQLKNSPRTLFPGTRGRYRVYYESFPKDGKVSSIIALADNGSQGRMDLLNPDPEQGITIDQSQPMAIAPQQEDVQQQHVIVPEKEHDVPEPKATPKPKKNKIGFMTGLYFICIPLLFFGFLANIIIEALGDITLTWVLASLCYIIAIVCIVLLFRRERNNTDSVASLTATKPESEHVTTPKPEKKEIGCFTFATIIISCFLVSGPLAYFLIGDFFENGNEYGLYVGIFFIVISIGLCILFIRGEKNDSDTPSSPSKSDSGLSLDATASAIMMGLSLGGKKDHKSDSDSLHDSLFWQEKYRKDKY